MKVCETLEPKKGSVVQNTWSDGAESWNRQGLTVHGSHEEFDIPSGVSGSVQPVGAVQIPVRHARCNGMVRFIVVEQDISPLSAVGLMRTLQARFGLEDDGDQVLFRRFGGEADLRALETGHTVISVDSVANDECFLSPYDLKKKT